MSLQNLMGLSKTHRIKQGMSEDRLRAVLPELRYLISFFREYPDIFVDFIKGDNCKFQFFFYQRIMLRVIMRHKYVYIVMPRAASKSFIAMMAQHLRDVLYPNSALFVTTGGIFTNCRMLKKFNILLLQY